jgi:cyclopropane-fatty-acyl-phospholipid synthase
MHQRNSRRSARRHAAHHYDLPHAHYRQFLDTDLQYSCAYFADPSFSLEQAQEAKKRHIAAKLLLEPGLRVLDVGCGWGGLALSLAETERVEVVGVTLSREQLTVARQRAKQTQLDERVRFTLNDYREIEGPFDRIVSVGMFEHVGAPNYARFFQKIRELLSPDGIALIHSRPQQWPNHHECMDTKVHFPGRTHSRSLGGRASHRTCGSGSHRFGGPAPALCRDASSLA